MAKDIFFVGSGETSPSEYLRMGYDDLSDGGEATALLEVLPEQVVQAIHKYSYDGPTDVVGLVAHVDGLIQGLDERDPERNAKRAIEEASAEIVMSRALVRAFIDYPRLPFLGRLSSKSETSPDSVRICWGVVGTDLERADAETYLPTLELSMAFLLDPEPVRANYEKAMLKFMNDVLFRPDVIISR